MAKNWTQVPVEYVTDSYVGRTMRDPDDPELTESEIRTIVRRPKFVSIYASPEGEMHAAFDCGIYIEVLDK